jgi:hypothetical protein
MYIHFYKFKRFRKYLKHATSRGCNAWFVCDGKVLKFNPIALVLFKHIFKPIGVVAI